MTSSGNGWPRLREALDRGDLGEALAAAEMRYVGLVEALELVLLLADDENERRFERAALRWHARFCDQHRGIRLDKAQAILALLALLRGACWRKAAHALAEFVHRRGLERGGDGAASAAAAVVVRGQSRRTRCGSRSRR